MTIKSLRLLPVLEAYATCISSYLQSNMAFWRTWKSDSLVSIHLRSSYRFISLLLPASFRAVDLPPVFSPVFPYALSAFTYTVNSQHHRDTHCLGTGVCADIHFVDTHFSAFGIPSIQSLLKPIPMFELWTSCCDLRLSSEATSLSFEFQVGEGCPGSCTSFLGYWRPFVDVRAWVVQSLKPKGFCCKQSSTSLLYLLLIQPQSY